MNVQIAMTMAAQRNDIQPVSFIVTITMMIMVSLIVTARACLLINRLQLSTFDSMGNSYAGLDAIAMFFIASFVRFSSLSTVCVPYLCGVALFSPFVAARGVSVYRSIFRCVMLGQDAGFTPRLETRWMMLVAIKLADGFHCLAFGTAFLGHFFIHRRNYTAVPKVVNA